MNYLKYLENKLKWLYAELRYLVTRDRCEVMFTLHARQELEKIKKTDSESYEEIMKILDKLSRNPYIGEPVEDEE